MLNTYVSVSKQFREHVGDIMDNISHKFAEKNYGLDLNSFNPQDRYTSCKDIIGDVDVLFTAVDQTTNKVGKGCYRELQYASRNNIPVFVVNKYEEIYYLSKHIAVNKPDHGEFVPNSSDYRNYWEIPAKYFNWDEFFTSMEKYNFRDVVIANNRSDVKDAYNARNSIIQEDIESKPKASPDTSSPHTDELLLLSIE